MLKNKIINKKSLSGSKKSKKTPVKTVKVIKNKHKIKPKQNKNNIKIEGKKPKKNRRNRAKKIG